MAVQKHYSRLSQGGNKCERSDFTGSLDLLERNYTMILRRKNTSTLQIQHVQHICVHLSRSSHSRPAPTTHQYTPVLKLNLHPCGPSMNHPTNAIKDNTAYSLRLSASIPLFSHPPNRKIMKTIRSSMRPRTLRLAEKCSSNRCRDPVRGASPFVSSRSCRSALGLEAKLPKP